MEPAGRYRVVRKLGEGGMGIVYAAHDHRLDRPVAIKRIRPNIAAGGEQQRLWREARAASSVSHPNVCQLYDIDEDSEGLYLTMELLEGESLSDRLARERLTTHEAVGITLDVLRALAALHRRGVIHRDLKPSNIFLSTHGVKLLDFGLARPLAGSTHADPLSVTLPGVIVGTPRYLAPESIQGATGDVRTDLFSLGIILYEMLAGVAPFRGDSVVAVTHAILNDEPPALGGSPGIVGLDRIVHRALRKQPDERYQSADAFADDLRAIRTDAGDTSRIRPLSRLAVLPFRLLRPDASVDFLAFSLPDAISTALANLPSLVVRATRLAARVAEDPTDFRAVANALDVDLVLSGTLLSSGGQVRVNAQLVDARSGTLLRAMTTQASADDVFQLQDALTQAVVDSLSLSLTASDERRISRDTPASPEAYALYLRANQVQLDSRQWEIARDLYLRCVELDPEFAPAWARLGRCYRLLGKYDAARAQDLERGAAALRRALDINPDLTLAHNLYAHVEIDAGRAREAVARLLERVRRSGSDPELFSGLVQACRYCGLLDASVAAYERARSLDPGVVTSAAQTFLLKGEWQMAMAIDRSDPPFTRAQALVQLGRTSEAVALLRASAERGLHPQLRDLVSGMIAALEGRYDEVIHFTYRVFEAGFADHEVFYHWAGALAQAGDHDGALGWLERAIEGGFHPASSLASDRRFDPLRALGDFRQIQRRAEELHGQALETFRTCDGPRLLGVPS